ncbi:MAG TPA: phosphoribosyltransferase family protein [Pyrinomonadaceae bacterium]|nr:phosphoribosyltransferase family protein [Pyrinomonadaceae bacterium]
MSDSETTFLYRISELPLDADAEIFRQYPAFKLGVTSSVRYYAQLMLPLMKRVIANESEHTNWILTGPAIAAETQAAANLLCRELFDLYLRERDKNNAKELSLIDIQYDNEATASIDYAKMDFADRLTLRERLSQRLVRNPDFHGRPVLFINDVCVTGAQQQAMQQYFERDGVACVRWLYLIVIDPEIGRTNPKIEWQINSSPFEDLLRMVSREQIQFTGKCLTRLMHLSLAELDQILRALNAERRARLLKLVELNRFQNLDDFRERAELVRSYATQGTVESKSADGLHVGT